ncbi:hypothetical protein HanIR_Chr03g0134321 [Helianthus annuus]|nr:hypothetical protein HanIR_Chr03g0134321 [Helianthus annuus]
MAVMVDWLNTTLYTVAAGLRPEHQFLPVYDPRIWTSSISDITGQDSRTKGEGGGAS